MNKEMISTALGTLLVFAVVIWWMFDNTKSVNITSKSFACVEAEPDGLETRCVAYRRRLDK